MNGSKRYLTILLVVVIMVLAFLAGVATASTGPPEPQAVSVTVSEWTAIQTSNALLLDQGLGSVYLPIVLRR
jgi:hypothetical protein